MKNSSNILPNGLVGLPYFVMTKFLKYTTEWIGRTTIYCNDKITNILLNGLVGLPYFVMKKFLKYTTEWIGRTTIFCNDTTEIPQIYYRMDW